MPGPTFCAYPRPDVRCHAGALVDYPNYEHDLLRALDRLAAICDAAGVACIVPAVLSLEVGQLFEAFLLRRGRVVPLRLTMIRHQEGVPVSPWSPPVFDVAGTRIAVTFDAQRDLASLPGGCDLLLHFPVNGLDVTDCDSAAAAALPTGQMTERVARAGIWMACMAPSAVTTMRSIRAVPMYWTTGDVSLPLHRVSRSPCWYRMWCAGCPARRLRIARSRASIAAPGCGTACACICGIRSQRRAPGACSSPWTVAWRAACSHVWPSMPWGLGPSSRYMSSMMGHPMVPPRSSMPCAPALRGGGLSSSYSHGRARRPRYSPVVGWR